MHLTLVLSLSTEERAGKLTCSTWGLKNSFQPQKLNWPWINHSLSGNVAVTEQLYVDMGKQPCTSGMSGCVHPSQISRNPTGTRRRCILEENRVLLYQQYLSSAEEPALWDDSLVGSKGQRRYFSRTPLSTLQPPAPLLLKATRNMWPSATYLYMDYVKQTADTTWRCMSKRKPHTKGYSQSKSRCPDVFNTLNIYPEHKYSVCSKVSPGD